VNSPLLEDVALIICSPLRRTLETASKVFEGKDIPRVIEMTAYEMMETVADYIPDRKEWAARAAGMGFKVPPDYEAQYL
jgi:hypothetical protein